MSVSLIGIAVIALGLLLAPILARVMIAGLHLAGGWILATLVGYGTVYLVVTGIGLAAFATIEVGHHMGRRH